MSKSSTPTSKPAKRHVSKQVGASERGPEDLDQAKKNLGLPPDAVTLNEDGAQALASGKTAEETQREHPGGHGRGH